ncbi:MAG: hypothetical protein O2788_01605 [Chloroflexi bacterium]|nr:hypothetical protein [Chloroflexota bacterium]
MKRLILLALAALMTVGALACATDRSTSPVEGTVQIPNGFGYGSDDDGIMVQFLEVSNDSRCAAGVQCVRAGEAFVKLSISVDGGTAQESVIEMVPQGQATVTAGRFTVTLLELQPDPPPVGGVAQNLYTLKLRIEEK